VAFFKFPSCIALGGRLILFSNKIWKTRNEGRLIYDFKYIAIIKEIKVQRGYIFMAIEG
jgi:hypothetical protein